MPTDTVRNQQAALTDRASIFAFSFPLATVTVCPRLGALAFCASTCRAPDRNLARKGSLAQVEGRAS